MKKNIVSVGTALSVISSACLADNTNSSWAVKSVTASTVVASQYLGFGNGGVFYDKPVSQSDLVVTLNNGFYGLLWASVPFSSGWNADFGSEVDYGIGWSGTLGNLGVTGPISETEIDLGITYFDEPDVMTFGAVDVWYSHAKVSRKVGQMMAFILFENYTVMPGTPFEGGNLLSIGASASKDVEGTPISLFHSLMLTYDDGGFGFDNGFLLKGCFEIDWKVGEHVSLILPRVNYYAPLTVRDSRELDLVVAGGVSLRF